MVMVPNLLNRSIVSALAAIGNVIEINAKISARRIFTPPRELQRCELDCAWMVSVASVPREKVQQAK
jgi:hypothetical protein